MDFSLIPTLYNSLKSEGISFSTDEPVSVKYGSFSVPKDFICAAIHVSDAKPCPSVFLLYSVCQ